MDKVENVSILDTYENDIEYYIREFCERYGIEDLSKESQARWNSLLLYINKKVFYDKSLLKDKTLSYENNIPSNHNRYNSSLLSNICDYYIYLCFIYDKEISIRGYSYITGIGYDTIMEWGHGRDGATSATLAIYKKLVENREESLQAMLTDKTRKSPVGVLSILNHFYNWQTVYAPKSDTAPKLDDIGARYNMDLLETAKNVVQNDGNTTQDTPKMTD